MVDKSNRKKSLVTIIVFISICWLATFTFNRLFLPDLQVCTKEQKANFHLLRRDEVEPIENKIYTVGHIGGEATSIFVNDNYAYVKFGLELAVLDISNPLQINRVGYLLIPGDLIYLDKEKQIAFIHYEGLWKVDISNPANMSAIHIANPKGNITSIKIINDFSFINTKHCEYFSIGAWGRIKIGCKNALHIVNIVEPEEFTPCISGFYGGLIRNIFLIFRQELINNLQKTDGINGFIYTVSEKEGLQVFDKSTLYKTEINSYSPPFDLVDIFVYNSTAFVTNVNDNTYPYLWYDIHAVEITDITNPIHIGLVSPKASIMAVVDNFAFTSDGDTKIIKVIDLQNPFSNEKIILPPNLNAIIKMGRNHLYLYMFINIEGHSTTRLPQGMVIEDNLLYGFGGTISDISNFIPTSNRFPDRIGSFKISTGDSVVDLAVKNKIAYIADWVGILEILDLSDIQNPIFLSQYDAQDRINEIIVLNELVFITAGNSGLQIIDVSDPKIPKMVGSYITGTFISGLDIVCPYIYITDIDNGLFILETDFLKVEDCK